MVAKRHLTRDALINLTPRHKSLVGVDSDGCVFPTMEVKQKECFHPVIISHWGLEKIEKPVREAAEFVNLYSTWRGTNRFAAILKLFDFLHEHPAVHNSGVKLPTLSAVRRWVTSTTALGEPELEKAAGATGSAELIDLLKWSRAVNAMIAKKVVNISPYRFVLESLRELARNSDVICVSQTPVEALLREWEDSRLTGYVAFIAGQELGTKTEHLTMAGRGKYAPDKILMIGDAPGDRKAAQENHALFYPINPGHEEASWERFHNAAYPRFLAGTYAGKYEEARIAEFDALLPDAPPW